jgi:hypothetical protein
MRAKARNPFVLGKNLKSLTSLAHVSASFSTPFTRRKRTHLYQTLLHFWIFWRGQTLPSDPFVPDPAHYLTPLHIILTYVWPESDCELLLGSPASSRSMRGDGLIVISDAHARQLAYHVRDNWLITCAGQGEPAHHDGSRGCYRVRRASNHH